MNETGRIAAIIVGFVVAGFALGFLLEKLVQGFDSGAPLAGLGLGLGLGVAVAAIAAGPRHHR